MTVPASPVRQGVADELRRVAQRWQQLPLDRALGCLPAVHDVLARLVPLGVAATEEASSPAVAVPDFGPAIVMDQLTVLVYDASAADSSPGRARELEFLLAELRRALA